jgi:CheY-like chemotaxis protein
MHLLLIEDDQAYQLAMAGHLRALSMVHRVSVASDGEEGLALVRRQ